MRGIDITHMAEEAARMAMRLDCEVNDYDWDDDAENLHTSVCCVQGGASVLAVRYTLQAIAAVIDTSISPTLAQQLLARYDEALRREREALNA